MHPRNRVSIKSATVAGMAASVLLGLAGLTLNPAPAKAVVYCEYVGYPATALPGQASFSRLVRWRALRSVTTQVATEWWREPRRSAAVKPFDPVLLLEGRAGNRRAARSVRPWA